MWSLKLVHRIHLEKLAMLRNTSRTYPPEINLIQEPLISGMVQTIGKQFSRFITLFTRITLFTSCICLRNSICVGHACLS